MAESIKMILSSKAAIYVRVSTQFQVDKDSLSVQKRELCAYADLVLGIRDCDIFEDPGYSGKDTSRPAYQRMMARLRTGEYSHLIVWKIDRISRNLLDFAEMYKELKRLGVTFISKNEQFDTSTAIGEAMLKIILVFAELERNMTSERVTATMLSRAMNGQWNGGRVPYGYDWDKETKILSVNEKEADVYRFMCTLYEEKQSLLKVCKELNRRGIPTKEGNPWQAQTVHKLLTNVFYTGKYLYNVHAGGKGIEKKDPGDWIDFDDHHPAIIDDERFERIGRMLKRNRRKGPKRGDSYTGEAVHIFAGLMVCGKCGANMTASQDKRKADGYRPSMYGCGARRKQKNACTNKFLNDTAIAPTVFAALSGVLRGRDDPGSIEGLILSHDCMKGVKRIEGMREIEEAVRRGASGVEYAPPEKKVEMDAALLMERKRKCESSMKRLLALYLHGDDGISEEDYLTEKARLTEEVAEIDSLIESCGASDDHSFEEKASYFLMVEKLLADGADEAEKILKILEPTVPKAFLNMVIDQITIEDKLVTQIRFKSGLSMRFIR